jgi:exopolysaccharide biosynthesis polyprenyl glycosylphosphotransferase
VSSDLSTGSWAPSFEQMLTRLPEVPPEEVADVPRPLVQPSGPQDGRQAGPRPSAVRRNGPATVRRSGSIGLRLRLLIADVAAVAGSWFLLGAMIMPATTATHRWGAALVATAVTLAVMQILGLYRSRLCAQRGQETARIVLAVVAGAVTLRLLWGGTDRSYAAAIVVAGSCVLALKAFRWMYSQWLRAQRVQGRHRRGLIMIGTNEDAAAVRTMLDSQPELGYEVRGIIGKSWSWGRSDGAQLPNRPSLEQLPALAGETDATGVLLVANALSAAEVQEAIEVSTALGLHVQVWPGFRGLGARRVRRYPMSGETFLYVESGQGANWQFAAKRAIDLLGATLGLLIVAPVLLAAWIAIRLEGGGPAVFRQVRIGLDEKPFVVYKLRTMKLGANVDVDLAVINERTDGPLFKASHDPRVTRVGAVVRALSIDELPQFFNVLNGTMSLVGPRPALPDEVSQFDYELHRRHSVKPGITGLWQIEARDNPSFHTYRRLDLVYVDNWSIGLDLFIIVSTVPMVIAHAMSIGRREQVPEQAPSGAS